MGAETSQVTTQERDGGAEEHRIRSPGRELGAAGTEYHTRLLYTAQGRRGSGEELFLCLLLTFWKNVMTFPVGKLIPRSIYYAVIL